MIGKIILVKSGKSQQNVRLEIGWMNFLEVFRFHFHTGIEVVLVFEIVIHFIMAEESWFSTLKKCSNESYWSLRRLNCVSFTVHSRATTV